jgi:hypothetical protein
MRDSILVRTVLQSLWRRSGLAMVLGVAWSGAPAFAQYSTQGTVNASANVVRILSVTSTSDLSFGTFAPGPTAGTVVMTAAGNRTATGGVTLVSASAGAQGTVNLAGTPSTSYTVTLPSSVTLTAASGGATMTLGSFTTTLTGSAGSLNTSGTGSFGVGGTLTVSANQPISVYTGSFPVTLTYN